MTLRLFVVVLVWAAAGATAAAADADAGRHKASACLGCHGIAGYTNVYPSYRVPKLAGQYAEYIVVALEAYRSGERAHPTMRAQVHTLDASDSADIAAFFAALPAPPPAPAPASLSQEQEQKMQVCVGCHGVDGNSPLPQNPRLAGQYRDYLRQALLDYREGRRNNALMLGMVGLLDERDIEAFAVYFSKQQGLGTIEIGRATRPLANP